MNLDDCDRYEELAALRLYGELEGDEGPRLEAHLAGCARCRATAEGLRRGLGRLRGPTPLVARRRPRAWLAPAAAFAAGVSCALAWSALARPPASSGAPAPTAVVEPAFARATPPPQARDRGLGAVLAAVSRR